MSEEHRDDDRAGIWKKIHERVDALAEGMNSEMTQEELKDLWYRRAIELGQAQEDNKLGAEDQKLVTFRLGRDRYGVPIEMVREIQRAGGITAVPTAPDFVVGVMNLRGSILSVVDIRTFFGLPAVSQGPKARILVVESRELRVGLLVERVDEIAEVNLADLQPPLSLNKGITEDYIRGMARVRGEMLIVVDLGKILANPRLIVEEKV